MTFNEFKAEVRRFYQALPDSAFEESYGWYYADINFGEGPVVYSISHCGDYHRWGSDDLFISRCATLDALTLKLWELAKAEHAAAKKQYEKWSGVEYDLAQQLARNGIKGEE